MMAQVFDLSNYRLTYYALGPFLVGTLMVCLGIAVMIRERHSAESGAFLGMMLSGAIWLLSYGLVYLTRHEFVALWWIKVAHVGVCLIPSAVFLFALTIVKRVPAFRFHIWASFLLSGFFLFQDIAADQFITGLYSYSWGYYARYGTYNLFFLAFFGTMLAASLRILWSSYRCASSLWQRQRIKWFLLAFGISYLGSLDFLPTYGIGLYPLGYFSVFVYMAVAAWTIRRYHLVDVTPAFAAQQIIDNMGEALLVLDHEGIVRVVNPVTCRLFGRARKALVGKHISEVTNGFILTETLEQLMHAQGLRDYEIIFPADKGKEVVLSLSTSVLYEYANQPAAIVCLVRDITETKKITKERQAQAEALERSNLELVEKEKILVSLLEDLQASHEKLAQLAAIVESSEDAIISETLDGTVLSWNKGAEKIYGYSAEEMLGRSAFILSDPAYPQEMPDILQKIKQGKGVAHYERVRIRKDGRSIDVFFTLSPIRNAQGDLLGLSSISRDITQHKQAQELLRRNEERTRLIIETANDAFVAMDARGFVMAWNSQAERTFGWSRTEAIERPLADFIIPQASRAAHQKSLQHFLKTGAGPILNQRIELMALHRDGHEFPVELTVWPLRVGDATQFNAFIRDISARKTAEEALLQKTAELARSGAEREYLELFAFAASHDLQEPLQKIIAFGDLLKSKHAAALEDSGRDYLERMQNAAMRMSHLIEALLHFSKTTSRVEPFEEVALEPLVHEVLSDLELRVKETGAQIHVGKLPAAQANRMQLQEVFQNLISNALKFHKPGDSPQVSIESRLSENGVVEIEVRDNGIGFDEKYLAEIFKPFRRLHSRNEFEGNGMGLAICRKILLRHGGNLTAKSTPGKGSVFIIALPVLKKETILEASHE